MTAIARVWRWFPDHPRATIVIVLLATQLPFAGQAFHIDDRIYLEIAEQALVSPLYPHDYSTTFEGVPVADMASHSHLPLISYYLALVRALSGTESELIYHLAMLLFPLIAALAFYDLAARWAGRAPTAALMLVCAPAFMVSSHTLMTDVPMLACWLLAMSRSQALLEGEGSRSDRWLLLGAVAASSLISLLSLGLVLLLGVSWWMARKSDAARQEGQFLALVLLIPLLVWTGWYLRSWLHYDRLVLLETLGHMQKQTTWNLALLAEKALSFVLNVGGTFVFPLLLWGAFGSPISRRLALVAAALTLIPVFATAAEPWSVTQAILLVVFATGGLMVVTEIVRALSVGDRHERLAALWVGGIAAACLLLYSSGAVRYTLLALPPVLLLWVRSMQRRYQRIALPLLLRLSILATLVYGWPIASSDYRFAQAYRREAARIIDEYQPKGRVWFTGEWGLRYYFERGGARLLTRDGLGPEAGDIIVKPRLASPWVTRYDESRLELIEQRYPESAPAVRILDFSTHAGFYSTAWGILPYSVGTQPWEWFNVYRVTGRPERP